MRIVSFTASAVLITLLGGCATHPSLEEQLTGKSAAQRQDILIKTCHLEAGKGAGTRKSSAFGSHVQTMHKICDRMAHEFVVPTSSHGE